MDEDGASAGPRDDDLTDVAAAVLEASRALVGVAVRSLGEALEELTLQQYRVLVLVATHGPLRAGVLAEALGIHPSTFSRTADRLVAGGWVTRSENPESRREVLVFLTDAGRRAVETTMSRRSGEITAALGRLTVRDRRAVLRGMRLFAGVTVEASPAELAVLGVESGSALLGRTALERG